MKKAILDEFMKGWRLHIRPKKLCRARKTIKYSSEILSSVKTDILRAST